uniref:CBS domain-containing protein n=1 Tax=Oryza punctata TaxID=4537 RepID=A0A0E0KIS0_ORYPU
MTSPHRAREGRAHHHASRLTSSQVSSSPSSSPTLASGSSVLLLARMQRAIQAIGSHGSLLKSAVLRHINVPKPAMLPAVYSRSMSVSSAQIEESGFETATVADILKSKGKSADGSWLWCTTDDSVYDAVKSGRSSKSTKVGDIMTEENKLITVKPDTRVLQAMQLMTEKRIRHIPVIDGTGMVGMVSIGDIVRAVVSEHREELNRLNAYIQGGY